MVALSASAVLLLLSVVALGYPLGNIAIGFLISIHVSGIIYMLQPALDDARFQYRLLTMVAILFATITVLYLPLRGFVESHLLVPLRFNGHVIIVGKSVNPERVRLGDWVGYRIDEYAEHGILLREGAGLGPVLAVPGDAIRFTPDSVLINGVPHGKLPDMPIDGELVIPQNCWFIWPRFGIAGHGYTDPARISATILKMAVVHHDQMIGRPFRYWFGRKQHLT
jgi:hypothetical protein